MMRGEEGNEATASGLRRLRRGPREGGASVLLAVGVVMIMQSAAMACFTRSLVAVPTGTIMLFVVNHFRA